MKKPEFLKLLRKEILPQFPDYFLFRDMLIHKSSNEILKFVHFQNLSWGYIRCHLNVIPMFYPKKHFNLSYFKEVNNLKNIKSWNLDKEDGELDKLEDMIIKIRTTEKDFFDKIHNSLDFYNYYDAKRGGERHQEGIIYAACYSLKKGYREEIEKFLIEFEVELKKFDWGRICKEQAELLLKLSLDDENLMIEQLKEWMRYSLVQLKLDKLYKDKLKFEI